MKAFLAIVLAALYFAFSVGLTIQLHQCDDANMNSNDFLSYKVEQAEDDCQNGEVHACCKSKKESTCCSCSTGNNEDACCVETLFLIQIKEEQIASKNQFNIPLPVKLETLTCGLLIEFKGDNSKKVYFNDPPPIKEDKHIRYCSLTLYG